MIKQTQLGASSFSQKRKLVSLIQSGGITLGGYSKAKIYGMLSCKSGKRMKVENRVYFADEQEALDAGYRPCARCLPRAYKLWKAALHKNTLGN